VTHSFQYDQHGEGYAKYDGELHMRWLLGVLKEIVEAIFDSSASGGRRNPQEITNRERLQQQSDEREYDLQRKGNRHRDR
jgi:hypothetical protein